MQPGKLYIFCLHFQTIFSLVFMTHFTRISSTCRLDKTRVLSKFNVWNTYMYLHILVLNRTIQQKSTNTPKSLHITTTWILNKFHLSWKTMLCIHGKKKCKSVAHLSVYSIHLASLHSFVGNQVILYSYLFLHLLDFKKKTNTFSCWISAVDSFVQSQTCVISTFMLYPYRIHFMAISRFAGQLQNHEFSFTKAQIQLYS